MVFELQIFLYGYYGFLILWLLMSIAAVYHMLKFGFLNSITIFTTGVFIFISFLMLGTSFTYIYDENIDWNQEINIFEKLGSREINY